MPKVEYFELRPTGRPVRMGYFSIHGDDHLETSPVIKVCPDTQSVLLSVIHYAYRSIAGIALGHEKAGGYVDPLEHIAGEYKRIQ